LFEFIGQYGAFGPAHGLTCEVIRCHSRALRRLTVPLAAARSAEELACAVAECSVLEALDVTRTGIPFHSWAHLGSTLHTLSVHVPAVTFRMLAEHMPALRALCVHVDRADLHDGFIDVVSRLRSLEVRMYMWASLKVTNWPAALPNLEALVWNLGNGEDLVVAAEILRRAPSLRSASVPHAAALSAVQKGSLVHAADVPPLLHVRALTLTDVAEGGAALAPIVAAAPAVTSLRLRCASVDTLWRALDAAVALAKGVSGKGMSSRVRRLRLDTDRDGYTTETRRQLADRVVRLFPRVRVASCGDITDCITRRDSESSNVTIFPLD
jgi:hypothetical protein